jgi:hypothetical protein
MIAAAPTSTLVRTGVSAGGRDTVLLAALLCLPAHKKARLSPRSGLHVKKSDCPVIVRRCVPPRWLSIRGGRCESLGMVAGLSGG